MDNLVSRYVRPLIIVYLIAFFSIISIADTLFDDFNMRDIYIDVYATILQAAVGFYFTSRGVEKSVRIYRENADSMNTRYNNSNRDYRDYRDSRIFEDTEDIKNSEDFIDIRDTRDYREFRIFEDNEDIKNTKNRYRK